MFNYFGLLNICPIIAIHILLNKILPIIDTSGAITNNQRSVNAGRTTLVS